MGIFNKLFSNDKSDLRETIIELLSNATQSLQSKNYKVAAETYEKYFALKGEGKFPEIDEDDPLMLYNYSIAKFNLGDVRGAIVAASKAIQRKKFYQVYKVRATYYNEIDDFENSIKDLTVCIQIHPQDKAHYLCERGIAYKNIGDNVNSLKDIVESYELGDKSAEVILRENTTYFNR